MGTVALLSLAVLVLLATAFLLWSGGIHTSPAGSRLARTSGSGIATTPAAWGVDPRLILVPRTVTQVATAGGIRVVLAAGPLLPGSNSFALRLATRGRPLTGAGVHLVARMVGMAMLPVKVPMHEVQPGRYTATGPLPMFGWWQVTVRIDRPGMASLTHQFMLGMDLPRGLLATAATRHAPQQ